MATMDAFRKVVGFVIVLAVIVTVIYVYAYERISRVGNTFVGMFACPPRASCGTGATSECEVLASLDAPAMKEGDELMAGKCTLRLCNRVRLPGEPHRDYQVEVCRSAAANPGKTQVAPRECVVVTDPRGKVKQLSLAKEGVTEYECASLWRPTKPKLQREQEEVAVALTVSLRNSTGTHKVVDTTWNVRYQHPLEEA